MGRVALYMSKYDLEDDPHYNKAIRRFEIATRAYKRSLSELRRYYLNEDIPDLCRAAVLQQAAHLAHHELSEAMADLSKFSWELAPYNNSEEHLDRIAAIRIAAKERIAASPRKPGLKQVMVITKISEITKPKRT